MIPKIVKLLADHAKVNSTFNNVCPDIILAKSLIVRLTTLAKYENISIITNKGAIKTGIPRGRNTWSNPHPWDAAPRKFININVLNDKKDTITAELVNVYEYGISPTKLKNNIHEIMQRYHGAQIGFFKLALLFKELIIDLTRVLLPV